VPEAQQAAVRALRSGWITMGPQTADFERELASYLGSRQVVAVASCTAAIERPQWRWPRSEPDSPLP
jgi:dTDP-4-amino-4,6-dideoxygalactose transaminase